MEQFTFKEIIQEYANIFWNGNLENGKNASNETLEEMQVFNGNYDDEYEKFENLVKGKNIQLIGKINRFYNYEPHEVLNDANGRKITKSRMTGNLQVNCEEVVITDKNKLLFSLEPRIQFVNTDKASKSYELNKGDVCRFIGKIKYCDVSWGPIWPDNMYELFFNHKFDYGFPVLSLNIIVEVDASTDLTHRWVDKTLYQYTGADFNFPEGNHYFRERYQSQNTTSSNSKSDGMCFIATAAYGNDFEEEINTLYNFRDNVLSKSIFGILFIKAYYFLSPPLANLISKSELLRRLTRNYFLRIIVTIIRKWHKE